MTIRCESEENFYDTIAGLVQRGLTFDANRTTLIIKLLGGY